MSNKYEMSGRELDRIMREGERLRSEESGRILIAFGRWVKGLFAGKNAAQSPPAELPRAPGSAIF